MERESALREQLESLQEFGDLDPASPAAALKQGTAEAAKSEQAALALPPQAIAAQACRAYAALLRDALRDGAAQGARIVEAFEQRLDEAVEGVRLEVLFAPGAVKKMCTDADGTQPHLVAPEAGLRQLVAHAISQCLEPARECVWQAHAALVEAARHVAESSAPARRRPALYALLGEAAEVAADRWRGDAVAKAEALVKMESLYPTPHFFQERLRAQERAAEEERQRRLAAERQRRIDAARAAQGKAQHAELKRREADNARARAQLQQGEQDEEPESPNQTPAAPSPTSRGTGGGSAADLETLSPDINDARNFLMGYLEKRSDTASRWDKRWFVLNEGKCRLSYYRTPEDRTARGVIDMQRARPQDMLSKDSAEPTPVMRIAVRETGDRLLKDHQWLMLKAPSVEKKYEWLARLRAATEPPSEAIAYAATSRLSPPATPASPTATSATPQSGGEVIDVEAADAAAAAAAAEAAVAAETAQLAAATESEATEEVEAPRVRTAIDHERFLLEMGQAATEYVSQVFVSLVANIPKVVVHAMISRVEDQLLPELVKAVTAEFGRSDDEARMEHLVREDPSLEAWKMHARRSLEVIGAARPVLAGAIAEGHALQIARARAARKRGMYGGVQQTL